MLIDEIDAAIEGDVIPHLRKMIPFMLNAYDSKANVQLNMIPTSLMKAYIEKDGIDYNVFISKGWLRRLGYIFALADYFWSENGGKRRIHVVSNESAFDSYIFRESIRPSVLFTASRPMQYLFLDTFTEERIARKIENFSKVYYAQKKQDTNLPLAKELYLPSSLSMKAKTDLLICALFICSHETAHALDRQQSFLTKKEFKIVGMEELFLSINAREYCMKAAEVDADIAAINNTANYFINSIKDNDQFTIGRIFFVIFLLMATFDLGRQSIREYRGFASKKSTHPIPDLRAVATMYGLFEGINSGPNEISLDTMWEIFDISILEVVRTFEAFAIPNCGYHILANQYISFQGNTQGFISQVATFMLMQEELSKIERSFRELREMAVSAPLWIWRPQGFNFSDEEFKEKSLKEVKEIFFDKNRASERGEKLLETFLRNKRKKMNPGDSMLWYQHEFPPDIETNTKKYMMDERILKAALNSIFRAAEVKITPLDNSAEGGDSAADN